MKDSDPKDLRTGGALDILAEQASSLEDDDRLLGRRLGDYGVQALIGAGGMARVYRASRVDGAFERDVAIKVSLISGFNEELRARFNREQAILAELEHPNIARLFDAGLTDEGWPYIVMELVEGQPIDDYCRKQALSHERIVGLGIEVADTLSFAHTRLVAHCDLKPSNVLVTEDGRPVLLDFGIAKLLDADSDYTRAQRPLSPGYASPEQLLGQDITTASDTYQLGALLFQLLVGEPLVDDEALSDAIGRASRGDDLPDIDRRLKVLPRDLAHIVAMSLRREPTQRYRDAGALKADLENYLNHFPVSAVGNSRGYRLRTFARRNRSMLAVSGLAAVVILAGTLTYIVNVGQARLDAEREKQTAEESLNFLLGFFEGVSPEQAQDSTISAREVIDDGVVKVREDLGDKPEVQAKLMLALSSLYGDFGDHEQSMALAEDAKNYYEATYGPDRAESRQATANLARALFLKADYAEAAELYTQIIRADERLNAPLSETVLGARANLAGVYWYMGRVDEALAEYETLYALSVEALGERHQETINTGYNYATAMQTSGQVEASLPILEHQLTLAREELGENFPLTLQIQGGYAAALMRSGALEQATPFVEDLVSRNVQVHGEDHPESMNATNNLAIVYYQSGEVQKAVDVQADLIPRMAQVQGADHPRVLAAQSQLAYGLARLQQGDRAMAEIDEVIARQSASLGSVHPDTLNSRMYRAGIMSQLGDSNVKQYLADLVQVLEAELGMDHYRTVDAREELEKLLASESAEASSTE